MDDLSSPAPATLWPAPRQDKIIFGASGPAPIPIILATKALCRVRHRASRPGISIILATTFSSLVRSAAAGTAIRSPPLLRGCCHLASGTRPLSSPSSAATAILRMDPGSSEEYVRLRSQRDGGQFVVPVACLVEMSATMKGMFETDAFRENECLVDVPKSSITKAASSSSSSSSSLHLRGGADTSAAETAASQSRPLVVAVDGPAASGKGTLSRRLAERLNFAHLDTGSLYRATALRVMRAGLTPEESVVGDEPKAAAEALNITPEDLRDPDLRQEKVGQAASLISACPAVRKALLDYQHGFCRSPPGDAAGAVLDGRDIGTVIWPHAQAKIFVTAGVDTRALRRWKELMDAGKKVILEDVRQEMVERDKRDSSRDTAPLKPAEDAVTVETSDLDPDETFAAAWSAVADRLPGVSKS